MKIPSNVWFFRALNADISLKIVNGKNVGIILVLKKIAGYLNIQRLK